MDITGFAICLFNEDHSVSLELHKVYPIVAPYDNDPAGYIRVADESGEDYLFPAEWFESVHLGSNLEARIMSAISV
jgi:hypothetical protein